MAHGWWWSMSDSMIWLEPRHISVQEMIHHFVQDGCDAALTVKLNWNLLYLSSSFKSKHIWVYSAVNKTYFSNVVRCTCVSECECFHALWMRLCVCVLVFSNVVRCTCVSECECFHALWMRLCVCVLVSLSVCVFVCLCVCLYNMCVNCALDWFDVWRFWRRTGQF